MEPSGQGEEGMKREEFVGIWQTARCLSEVVSKCGESRSSCSLRAYRLRREGVPLQLFKGIGTGRIPDPSRLDEALRIARKLLPIARCSGCERYQNRIRLLEGKLDCVSAALRRRDRHVKKLLLILRSKKQGG